MVGIWRAHKVKQSASIIPSELVAHQRYLMDEAHLHFSQRVRIGGREDVEPREREYVRGCTMLNVGNDFGGQPSCGVSGLTAVSPPMSWYGQHCLCMVQLRLNN